MLKSIVRSLKESRQELHADRQELARTAPLLADVAALVRRRDLNPINDG